MSKTNRQQQQQNSGKKGDKGGKKKEEQEKPARKEKVVVARKHHGEPGVPDYTPREKREARNKAAIQRIAAVALVSGPDSTDPKRIWDGLSGIVALSEMRFRVTVKESGQFRFPVVYVLVAPHGTELFGLSGSNTYTTVGQLRGDAFNSKLPEGNEGREAQKRVWTFFRKVFAEAGLGLEKKPISLPAVLFTPTPPPPRPYGGAVIRAKSIDLRAEAVQKGLIKPVHKPPVKAAPPVRKETKQPQPRVRSVSGAIHAPQFGF